MTALLALVPPRPTLDDRLRANFDREDALLAELAQVRGEIGRDRLLYMAREGTYGLRVEAIRKAVRG